MRYQRDRIYELIVGDYKNGNGIRITEAQVTFDISKTADSKRNNGNSAVIEIYNLNREQISLLQGDFLECTFSVGYADYGARVVVQGNVVEVKTVKAGPDYITQLKMGEGYTDLNHEFVRGVVPPGSTVERVIEEIRKQMPNVGRGSYTGTNLNNPVVYGWRLNGTPAQMMRKLCEANNIEYTVTGGVMNVSDAGGLYTKNTLMAPVISVDTGMIDMPFHNTEVGRKPKGTKGKAPRKAGVQFKTLLNTECIPGMIVNIQSDFIKGFYRINSARFSGDYRGNDWYVECFATEVTEAELA